jgi:hypothetical protein
MNDVRIVGVKLQQIEEMPEHIRHFGFRALDACRASQLTSDYLFGTRFRRPRAHRLPPQSSSASRCTAGAAGFLTLSQWSTPVLCPRANYGGSKRTWAGIARGKPNLASQMPSGELPRLRYNESDAVVAVSDQIIVAKEKTRAQRRSDDAEFGKD